MPFHLIYSMCIYLVYMQRKGQWCKERPIVNQRVERVGYSVRDLVRTGSCRAGN